MKLNNVEVDFSFMDGDDIAKYEEGQKYIVSQTEKTPKNIALSESMKKEAEIINEFFDIVFGEGISKKIFKKPNDLGERIKLYTEIVEQANKEKQSYQSIFDKYSPDRVKRT